MFIALLGGDEALYDRCLAEALTGPNPSGLSDVERMAIWVYSSTDQKWYERINSELRGGAPSLTVQIFAELWNTALDQLPNHVGVVYRGFYAADLDGATDQILRAYDASALIEWHAFTSSSKDVKKAFPGNVLFIIRSQSGRVLGPYADKPAEEEILFKAGSRYNVTALEREADYLIVQLDEFRA
jgi:hypothetical protein